jgi:fucose 4-O-acetylase-like acetyltransferase
MKKHLPLFLLISGNIHNMIEYQDLDITKVMKSNLADSIKI